MVQRIFLFWKEGKMMNLQALYEKILKTGVTKYKSIYSKASLPERVKAEKEEKKDKKGAIFVVKSKEDFLEAQKVKGYIVTSVETLLEDAAGLSHFTPNVFTTFTYTDEKRRYIAGFSENNLLQINTFVVDIDTKKYTVQDILMSCMEDSVGLPTFIVETPNGYQVYFVLEQPIYISNKNDFRSLKVAKAIAKNIKRSLHAVEADILCNDFGFFRLPKEDNLVYCQLEMTYDVKNLIHWSMQQSDDRNESPFFVVHQNASKASVMETDWFTALVNSTHIKGRKGQLGRNNTLFTLALLCLQEGWDKERTMNLLDQFNSNLGFPLTNQEVITILESAYSGKYSGASKEYVEILLEEYLPGHDFDVKLSTGRNWYKFKKERSERTRSHYDEWEEDIIKHITAEFNVSEPFIWRTQKQICDAVGIPASTLNELMNHSSKLIRTVTGKGRNKITGWSTVSLFMKHVVFAMQSSKQAYRAYIQTMVEDYVSDCLESPAKVRLTQILEKQLDLNGYSGIDDSIINTS